MHKDVPISDIVDNPFQPRTEFDRAAIDSLADEIRAEGFWNGVLQGRKTENGKIQLVFGHRRIRALRQLKVPSVKIEVLDLTDAQMALRSLEENLQREGLTDLEKADGVKAAVDIVKAQLQHEGKSPSHAVKIVAQRLGLTIQWVSQLTEISSTIVEENRKFVEAGDITAVTAINAKRWGDDRYVETLARQGKKSKTDKSTPKPTQHTITGMRRALTKASKDAPAPIVEKVKDEIFEGKLTTPDQVERRVRSLSAARVRHEKQAPPDLKAVIVKWTHQLDDWEKQMRDVAPYMDYVEEVPAIADRFRKALKAMIATAQTLIRD